MSCLKLIVELWWSDWRRPWDFDLQKCFEDELRDASLQVERKEAGNIDMRINAEFARDTFPCTEGDDVVRPIFISYGVVVEGCVVNAVCCS